MFASFESRMMSKSVQTSALRWSPAPPMSCPTSPPPFAPLTLSLSPFFRSRPVSAICKHLASLYVSFAHLTVNTAASCKPHRTELLRWSSEGSPKGAGIWRGTALLPTLIYDAFSDCRVSQRHTYKLYMLLVKSPPFPHPVVALERHRRALACLLMMLKFESDCWSLRTILSLAKHS